MTDIEMAQHRLYDADALRVTNIKISPGSSRDTTPPQMAQQINQVLAQLDSGDFDFVEL